MDRSHQTLLVGIHVSQLDVEKAGEGIDSNAAVEARKEATSRWYIVSVTGKWSGSDGFYRAQTFLQRSCKPLEQFPNTYPGALAMEQVKTAIHELVDSASLAGSKIIVFHAGVPAGKLRPEENAELEADRLKGLETHVELVSPATTEPLGLDEQEESKFFQNGSRDLGMSTVENGQRPRATNGENASTTISDAHATEEYLSSNSNFGVTTEGATERAKKVSNPELEAFKNLAEAENATLAYIEIRVSNLARIFDQNGQPLCDKKKSIAKHENGTNSADVKAVSSVLIRSSMNGPDGATSDWMIQKMLPENTGPNRPLLLKIQWVDPQIRREHPLVDIVSEASWDFPRGTWSSKNLYCHLGEESKSTCDASHPCRRWGACASRDQREAERQSLFYLTGAAVVAGPR
jgi:hypothetical protein